jgi:hypothetical protein
MLAVMGKVEVGEMQSWPFLEEGGGTLERGREEGGLCCRGVRGEELERRFETWVATRVAQTLELKP